MHPACMFKAIAATSIDDDLGLQVLRIKTNRTTGEDIKALERDGEPASMQACAMDVATHAEHLIVAA